MEPIDLLSGKRSTVWIGYRESVGGFVLFNINVTRKSFETKTSFSREIAHRYKGAETVKCV